MMLLCLLPLGPAFFMRWEGFSLVITSGTPPRMGVMRNWLFQGAVVGQP